MRGALIITLTVGVVLTSCTSNSQPSTTGSSGSSTSTSPADILRKVPGCTPARGTSCNIGHAQLTLFTAATDADRQQLLEQYRSSTYSKVITGPGFVLVYDGVLNTNGVKFPIAPAAVAGDVDGQLVG
jgi:hypothetical protein